MVPKNNKHQGYPLHVQKNIYRGTDPCLSCESRFCMNYMSMCAKSGLRNELCRHLGQVVAANTSFPEPAVLLDEILDSLGPGDESFDKILKVETIEKCKELNTISFKNNITPVVSMDAESFLYLSVYNGKRHYCAPLNHFIVMFTKKASLLDCRCCNRKINCIYKAMAIWFLKQTDQLSRPWSQAIGVNKTDNRELMTKNCESSFSYQWMKSYSYE